MGQIDLGSVMGTGFAPFQGGILNYAETRGIVEITKRLSDFTAKFGKRFTPCQGLVERAKKGDSTLA